MNTSYQQSEQFTPQDMEAIQAAKEARLNHQYKNTQSGNKEVLEARRKALIAEAERKAHEAQQMALAEEQRKSFTERAFGKGVQIAALLTNAITRLINKVLAPIGVQLPLIDVGGDEVEYKPEDFLDYEALEEVDRELEKQKQADFAAQKQAMENTPSPQPSPSPSPQAKQAPSPSNASPTPQPNQAPTPKPGQRRSVLEDIEAEFAADDRARNARPSLNGATFAPGRSQTWNFKRAVELLLSGKAQPKDFAKIAKADAEKLVSMPREQLENIARMSFDDVTSYIKTMHEPKRPEKTFSDRNVGLVPQNKPRVGYEDDEEQNEYNSLPTFQPA